MSDVITQCDVRPAWAARHRRGVGLLVALPCWLLLLTGLWLRPNPAGHGTHTQLGMPPCSMMQHTGLPCPTCGMTTSVSYSVRLQLGRAVHAQPFGPIFAAGILALALAGSVQAATGREIVNVLGRTSLWVWLLLAGFLAGWAIKLAWGLAVGELPIR